ncbi:MAG: CsgG/HfaB family protein [Gemmatimonadaceae bacterium]
MTACWNARSFPTSSCLLLLLASCALPQRAPTPAALPDPSSLPALQQAFARDSSDPALRVRLAEAQRRAGQPAIAARLLEPIAATMPVAEFYLGLVREDQGRPTDARLLYERYLARAASGELRDRVRDRLSLLGRLELQQAIRTVVANERTSTTRPTDARVVGVFPFLTSTSDPQLHPLGTAFAELLSNDLAQTDRLRVVERVRLQQLLDEIQLTESRRVDPATAVRSGRLLGAGTLVQGRIEGGAGAQVNFQAAVVRVQAPTAAVNPLRERDALTRLFDVEKKLAFGIYSRMGVQLTSAERDRVARHATRNVQALLELGYGLEAQDAGRYAEAATHFARAAQLDPAFALARQKSAEATVQARAAGFTTAALGQLALASVPDIRVARAPNLVRAADRPQLRAANLFAPVERLVPNPSVRDAGVEALGVEGVTRSGTADLVIRRPGATP